MRVQATFVALILIATTAMSLVWRDFESAREGDAASRAIVLALAPIGAVAFILASRIVIKAHAARQRVRRG